MPRTRHWPWPPDPSQTASKKPGTVQSLWRARFASALGFGSAPLEPQPLDEDGKPRAGPLNRRAEMWMKSREWLEEPGGVQVPDSDSLQADAGGPSYAYDSLTRLQIEKKEDMRRRGVASPDEWDAVALTFAEPVVEPSWQAAKPRSMSWVV